MRLNEVGDVVAADGKVQQAEDIREKDGREHNIEELLPGMLAAGHVLLCAERGVEGLILRIS